MDRTSARSPELLALVNQGLHPQLMPALVLASLRVQEAADPATLLSQVWKSTPDLLLIEVVGSHTIAEILCRQLRPFFLFPILVVEQGVSETDRIALLDSGADDVLALHDSPNELPVRCAALMRRVARQRRRNPDASFLCTLGMRLDVAGRRLYLSCGSPLALSVAMTRFLAALFSAEGGYISLEAMGRHMYGYTPTNLRRRLYSLTQNLYHCFDGRHGPLPAIIYNKGFGYRISLRAEG